MKNWFFGLLTVLLVMSLVTGCSDGSSDGPAGRAYDPLVIPLKSVDNIDYFVVFSTDRVIERQVMTPQSGDRYLIREGSLEGTIISQGRLTVNGIYLTFMPSDGAAPFYGSLSGSSLTLTTINTADGRTITLTRPSGGGGGGGSPGNGGNGDTTYTVTFNSDGGSAVASQTVASGGKATKPAVDPTKHGMDFVRWVNAADDTAWDFDTAITGNITLKAEWDLLAGFFLVTFVTGTGGSDVPSQAVADGQKAEEPAEDPTTTATTSTQPTTAGLYRGAPGAFGYDFVEWQSGGSTFDFDTAITADITLDAHWGPVAGVAANDVATAVTHINANAGTYTLLLDNDATVSAVQNLNTSNVKLTIIGLSSEREILRTDTGPIFFVGTSGQTGIELTLGNNITLKGHASNNSCVVRVEYGAALTMLEGSKISGNTSSATTELNGMGAAVNLYYNDNTLFTMKGGTITGNSATGAGNMNPGGLYVYGTQSSGTPTVILEGGSIEGNTGAAGDVYVERFASNFTLSGNAKIGTLTMNAASSTNRATLTISTGGWSGTITGLNLRGMSTTMSTVIGYWANNPILLGGGVNAGTVGQITLGNFMSSTAGVTQAIDTTHVINASGVLVLK